MVEPVQASQIIAKPWYEVIEYYIYYLLRNYWFTIPIIIAILIYLSRNQLRAFISKYELKTKLKQQSLQDKILNPSKYQLIGLALCGLFIILFIWNQQSFIWPVIIFVPFMVLSIFLVSVINSSVFLSASFETFIVNTILWGLHGYLITSLFTYLINRYKKEFTIAVFIGFCIFGVVFNFFLLAGLIGS